MTRRKHKPEDAKGPGYVRLWRGLIDHLPYFAEHPVALVVFNWALLTRDHRTGLFVADFRDMSNQTALSQHKIKRAIAWLRHGRGCGHCQHCLELPIDHHPSYIKLTKRAAGQRSALYQIRRDDSGRQIREKFDRHQGELGLDEPDPKE